MTKSNEKLLIGVLAGIIIAGAGAFAIQPALAGKAGVKARFRADRAVLRRADPAAHPDQVSFSPASKAGPMQTCLPRPPSSS